MNYALTLTRSQQMALISLLGEEMAREGTFTDVSQSPPVVTTAGELFQLVLNAPRAEEPTAEARELQDWRELFEAFLSLPLPPEVRGRALFPNKRHMDCAAVAFTLHKAAGLDVP